MCSKNVFAILILIGNGWLQIVSDHEEDGRMKLADILHGLGNVQPVFGRSESVSLEDIQLMPVERLTELVRQRYDDLTCSYLLSGRIYMRLVERLLVDVRQLRSVPRGEDLSFTNETARMLATVHNADALGGAAAKNVMWIFYVHAETLWEHLKSVISGADDDGDEDRDAVLADLKCVKILFKKSLASGDCRPFVEKNRVGRLLENVLSKTKTTDTLLDEFTATKAQVTRRLDGNAECGISAAGHQWFSMRNLSLDRVMVRRRVVADLTDRFQVHVEWRPILDGLRSQYCIGLMPTGNSLSHRIRSLATFQHRFVQLVKVILVRLCLKRVTCEHGALLVERYQIASRNDFQLFDLITDFMGYLQLDDDGDLIRLRAIFQKTRFQYRNIDYTATVESILDDISPKLYHSKLSDPMPNLPYRRLCPLSRLPIIKRITNDIRTYVEYVKQVLRDVNFNVIHTFIGIMRTEEFGDLISIEDYYIFCKKS